MPTEQVSPAAVSPAATPQTEAPAPVVAVDASVAPSPVAVTDATTPAVTDKVAVVAEVKKEDSTPTTLLDSGAEKKADVSKTDKAVEANKAPEVNKEEGSQSDKTAQLPTYEDFKLPEGFTHDKEKLSSFIQDLGELQTKTKAEQKLMQDFGQKLMDKYVAEVQGVIKQVKEQSVAEQNAKVTGWKTETEKLSDKDTLLASAGKSLSYLPEDLKKQFKSFYNETGIGNNSTLLRTLAHYESIISGYQKKYESEADVKPVLATAQLEKPKGMANKMYGSMK